MDEVSYERSGGRNLVTLKLRLARKPPLVIDRVPPAIAPAMIAGLVDRGGDGFPFTIDDLAHLGPAMRIADLAVGEGTLDLDLDEGLQTSLRSAAVDVIVRARLVSTVKQFNPVKVRRVSSMGRRYRSFDSIKAEIESQSSTDVRVKELLDLHTSDGSIYRIDGDRFEFRALGTLRGHGDKANMDSMSELLGHICPDAVVDTYYELFRPPPGYQKLRLRSAKGTREDPAFAFYSRWAALTYRHVLTG